MTSKIDVRGIGNCLDGLKFLFPSVTGREEKVLCRTLPSTNRGRRYVPSYQARSSLRACYPAASTLFCHPLLLRPVAADVGVEQGDAYYTFEVNAGDGQARSSRARRTGV